jgi:hypothetical protein
MRVRGNLVRRRTAAAVALAVVGAAVWLGQPALAAHHPGGASDAGCLPLRTFPLPPPGFSPLRATAAQLRRYGFPPRPPAQGPGAAEALAAWNHAMAHSRHDDGPPHPICSGTAHLPGIGSVG